MRLEERALRALITPEIESKLDTLDLGFSAHGHDRFGISRQHLGAFYRLLSLLYRGYLQVESRGLERLPEKGRAMLISNHTGGIPLDAGMIMSALFFESNPPRHAHGMVEKFAQNLPFLSSLFSRVGQLTGLPEHAKLILEAERLLLVFPEGARGTGKLASEGYALERFGTGFMRLALTHQSPIVPCAFVGAVEAIPIVYHSKLFARLLRVPYFPISSHLFPLPKRTPCQVEFGEPMYFEGDGNEPDEIIFGYIDQVRAAISELIERGQARRQERLAALAPKESAR